MIEDIVRRENRESGTTVVLVTHNVFQAKRLATRVGRMLSGRLLEIGSTTHVGFRITSQLRLSGPDNR